MIRLFALALCLALGAPAAAQDQNATAGEANATTPRPPGAPQTPLTPLDLPLPNLEEDSFEPVALTECLCQKALAGVTCKDPSDYSLIRTVEAAYKYNSFYGSGPEDFYCQALNGRLILSSTAWGKIRISVPFETDDENHCVSATTGRMMCDTARRITCCEEAKPESPF